MATLEDKIEAYVRECDEPPTVRAIAARLKVRQVDVLECLEESDRFNTNTALMTQKGYAELAPADYTVECLK